APPDPRSPATSPLAFTIPLPPIAPQAMGGCFSLSRLPAETKPSAHTHTPVLLRHFLTEIQ
ncbi:hypothetical protein, partial [Muribaculum intestinale]|uniref:hypothetical protein n=1 Tax=Muribaculum intestinale TaxID=1796646 RepID=UPI00272C3B02